MTSVKVSALPAAGTLNGSETVPVVQGGVTKGATASQIAGATGAETVVSPAINSGGLKVDLTLGTIFTVALDAVITTLSITGAPAGFASSFILEFTADGTPRSVTMPGNVTAVTGAYSPSLIVGKRDRLVFDTLDGGTTWQMWIAAQGF